MATKTKAIPNPTVRLHEALQEFVDSYANPDRKSNDGRIMHQTWLWQEMENYAADMKKASWKLLQAGDDALVPTDEQLRDEHGESILADVGAYSCVVKVEAPRRNFDQDTFVAIVGRNHNISAAKLEGYVDRSKKETKPVLTKRIVRAGQV